jgi:hypothetical protein
MAIYERTQRESAHVFSRVVDKSQVPSALNWAALGCVTASKGELNKVYQINTTDLLASIFGEPTTDHIALVCADKIIAEDNTMFIIRVAHENSLRGAQVIVSTDDIYGDKKGELRAIGIVDGNVTPADDSNAKQNLVIHVVNDDDDRSPLTNIVSDLSMDIVDDPIRMENSSVTATYREVYQLDDKGNKSYSEELCLLLSDVVSQKETAIIEIRKSGEADSEPLEASQYEANWFYSDGYAKRSVIVLKPSSNIVENTPCDIIFEMDQVLQRAYGTASPNKVTLPIAIKTNDEGGGGGGDDDFGSITSLPFEIDDGE